jgi:hypothetical protein
VKTAALIATADATTTTARSVGVPRTIGFDEGPAPAIEVAISNGSRSAPTSSGERRSAVTAATAASSTAATRRARSSARPSERPQFRPNQVGS